MYLIHEAVEKSGSVTDRKKFRDTLAGIKDFEGATGQFALMKREIPDGSRYFDCSAAENGFP